MKYVCNEINCTSGKSWHISRICFKAGNTHLSFFNSSTNLVIHVIFWASLSYKMYFVCCWLNVRIFTCNGLKIHVSFFWFCTEAVIFETPPTPPSIPPRFISLYVYTHGRIHLCESMSEKNSNNLYLWTAIVQDLNVSCQCLVHDFCWDVFTVC